MAKKKVTKEPPKTAEDGVKILVGMFEKVRPQGGFSAGALFLSDRKPVYFDFGNVEKKEIPDAVHHVASSLGAHSVVYATDSWFSKPKSGLTVRPSLDPKRKEAFVVIVVSPDGTTKHEMTTYKVVKNKVVWGEKLCDPSDTTVQQANPFKPWTVKQAAA